MTLVESTHSLLRKHLEQFWPDKVMSEEYWEEGPIVEAIPDFRVVRLAPRTEKGLWVYCSSGVSAISVHHHKGFEFFILSPVESTLHVETLAMLSYFHLDRGFLTPGTTVSIGRPWLEESSCDHLLISLPYPYGPELEKMHTSEGIVRILWALPITAREAAFAELKGVEALETLFDRQQLNYLSPKRPSVV